MILSANTIYTTRLEETNLGFKRIRDLNNQVTLVVDGGEVVFYVGFDPDDLMAEDGNPYADETVEYNHQVPYIAYVVLSGNPVVSVPDGYLRSTSNEGH